MDEKRLGKMRRTFRWPKEARELVRMDLDTQSTRQRGLDASYERRALITKIAQVSGNPRDACWRFARQSGIGGKRVYHQWTEPAQRRLLELIAIRPLPEVAITMR